MDGLGSVRFVMFPWHFTVCAHDVQHAFVRQTMPSMPMAAEGIGRGGRGGRLLSYYSLQRLSTYVRRVRQVAWPRHCFYLRMIVVTYYLSCLLSWSGAKPLSPLLDLVPSTSAGAPSLAWTQSSCGAVRYQFPRRVYASRSGSLSELALEEGSVNFRVSRLVVGTVSAALFLGRLKTSPRLSQIACLFHGPPASAVHGGRSVVPFQFRSATHGRRLRPTPQ
jgi:hypothetical protein